MAAVVVAGDQSLISLVDDEQWLDQASEQTLGFVARRLAADPAATARGDHANDYERRLVNDTAARIYCTSLRQGF
jgi:hypothetical protein